MRLLNFPTGLCEHVERGGLSAIVGSRQELHSMMELAMFRRILHKNMCKTYIIHMGGCQNHGSFLDP